MKPRLKPGAVTFTDHPLFTTLKPFLYLDFTGTRDNYRIQLRRRNMPHAVRAQARQLITPCVTCGEPMHPLRNGRYFAAACPITKNIACSRTANASIEYWKIRESLAAR